MLESNADKQNMTIVRRITRAADKVDAPHSMLPGQTWTGEQHMNNVRRITQAFTFEPVSSQVWGKMHSPNVIAGRSVGEVQLCARRSYIRKHTPAPPPLNKHALTHAHPCGDLIGRTFFYPYTRACARAHMYTETTHTLPN